MQAKMNVSLSRAPRVALLPDRCRLNALAVERPESGRRWPRLRVLFWWLVVAGWVSSAFCAVLAEHEELPSRTRLLLALVGTSTMALDLLATLALVWSLEPVAARHFEASEKPDSRSVNTVRDDT